MHRWKFFKAGSSYQVSIDAADDIKNIRFLDKKLWSALACPTSGLAFDTKLLKALDSDGDGRIRHADIVGAAERLCSSLKDVSALFEESPSLPLSNINDETDEGRTLLASARTVLENIGKAGANEISVNDFSDTAKIFADSAFNADGVITELSCGGDDSLKALFCDILSVSEPKIDRSGRAGIDAGDIVSFFEQASSYISWLDKKAENPGISPFGDETAGAYGIYISVKGKIEDYFIRSEAARFDPDAAAAVNAGAERISKVFEGLVSRSDENLKSLPAARISADGTLDLLGAVNPAWEGLFTEACGRFIVPVCGTSKITAALWSRVVEAFAPYEKWAAARPECRAAKIPEERLRLILSENKMDALLSAVAADAAVAAEVEDIEDVEELVRLNKSFCSLLRNFVSFQDFYRNSAGAIFQFGSLYIDSRKCSLCMKVGDVSKHSAMAALSYGYLLYCACKRKGESDMNIVAVVTAGDSDNLIVGKNGIFYDRAGRDWDATVVKIVDNPIGIAQAFFSPYKRLVKWASEQIAKRALSADRDIVSDIQKGAVVDDKTKKIDIGTVAALGVAVGGITTAFGIIFGAFVKLGVWMPLGVAGIILAISLPSVAIAAMKLGLRNISPILDANGWAVNSKAGVNMVFGARLTQTARRLVEGGKD